MANGLAGRSIGMILLGIWLILTGLVTVLKISVSPTAALGLAVVAIAAGILILFRR